MRAAFSKAEIESEVTSRFSSAFKLHEKLPAEVISTGIPEIDFFTLGGLPRGAITEIFGSASSGRTSFMFSALAHATRHEEVCALVDTSNSFDPKSATRAEINCERLLWIRCANNLEHAFKATDLLLQGGGFGLVLLDLGDVPANSAKRIISSWWYRFRRTLEPTPTALVVIAEESCVRSCATLALGLEKETVLWSNQTEIDREFASEKIQFVSLESLSFVAANRQVQLLAHANLLHGLRFQVNCHKPLFWQRAVEKIVCNAV